MFQYKYIYNIAVGVFTDFNYHTYQWRYEPFCQSGYFQLGPPHDRCWPLTIDLKVPINGRKLASTTRPVFSNDNISILSKLNLIWAVNEFGKFCVCVQRGIFLGAWIYFGEAFSPKFPVTCKRMPNRMSGLYGTYQLCIHYQFHNYNIFTSQILVKIN